MVYKVFIAAVLHNSFPPPTINSEITNVLIIQFKVLLRIINMVKFIASILLSNALFMMASSTPLVEDVVSAGFCAKCPDSSRTEGEAISELGKIFISSFHREFIVHFSQILF